jgi:hypothetical protein
MMKKLLVLYTLLLLNQLSFSQVNDDITFFENSYDKKLIVANQIETVNIKMYSHGSFFSSSHYDFDKLGNLTNLIISDSIGKRLSEFNFKYNSYGDLVFRKENNFESGNSYEVNFFKTYKNDRLVKDSSTELPFVYEYYYNENNQLTQTVISFDASGKMRKIISNIYGKDDQVVRIIEKIFNANTDTVGTIVSQRLVNYNVNGKKIEEIEEIKDTYGFLNKGSIEYIYDEKGNLSEIKPINAAWYGYRYNDQGLIISKHIFMDLPDNLLKGKNFKANLEDIYTYGFRK